MANTALICHDEGLLCREAVIVLASRQLGRIELAKQAEVVGDDPDS
jgi:hypothetical protein